MSPGDHGNRRGLTDTADLGEPSQEHLHIGKRTLRLRDGRGLGENGWVERQESATPKNGQGIEGEEPLVGDVDVLESVLSKDEALIGGVTPDVASRPTDCPDYDVTRLVDHLVEWMASFAAAAEGSAPADDPAGSAADPTPDPAARFREHAERCVAAWREQGTERTVRFMSSDLPAGAVLAMTLMEFATHGCDLARATDQPVPFTDAELELVLERALVTLPDQYRGDGQPFGPRVDVPDTAPAVDRLRGFMGRTP